MLTTLSATDVAIGLAIKEETLRLVPRWSERFSAEYYCLEDDHGVIEVHLTHAEATQRITEIEERIDA